MIVKEDTEIHGLVYGRTFSPISKMALFICLITDMSYK